MNDSPSLKLLPFISKPLNTPSLYLNSSNYYYTLTITAFIEDCQIGSGG